ncbi:hypothetical protein BIT28_15710 [Photobacterium proteolyticum]|uniref:Uncharacterized protein n=1 Tax=Photobacterium proteolyticum TaxID=1903952 RepID=A0A1Q9GYU2_9GAMM|nr:hypothetical protein [Photobacterium proteolyticum]OLQ80520.1 hypothetical protein BIT28_15710 [Photobacterium proteolyticum]
MTKEDKAYPLIRLFKVLHVVGLLMVIAGIALLMATEVGQTVNGMLAISSLIGIGGVLISPFPVALFLQWATRAKMEHSN